MLIDSLSFCPHVSSIGVGWSSEVIMDCVGVIAHCVMSSGHVLSFIDRLRPSPWPTPGEADWTLCPLLNATSPVNGRWFRQNFCDCGRLGKKSQGYWLHLNYGHKMHGWLLVGNCVRLVWCSYRWDGLLRLAVVNGNIKMIGVNWWSSVGRWWQPI